MYNIYLKYKEQINYLIFGVLTTVISLVAYYLLTITLLNPNNAIELGIANVISWIVGVLFAYFTNKKYVFESKDKSKVEFIKFTSGRLLTLFFDILFMFIFVTKLRFNDKIMKLISNFVVIILNYIISKFFVFIKRKD